MLTRSAVQDPHSSEIRQFRAEVRAFIQAKLPADLREKTLGGFEIGKDEFLLWQRLLAEQGWAAPSWPPEYGGAGWDIIQHHVFNEESVELGAPALPPMGLGMVGPLIISAATEEQKQRLLPPMLEGSEFWCQGFSEPGSGSDLASLACRATPVDGGYVVSGSKIWTTYAHWADWSLVLTRTSTDRPVQKGITLLAVDMRAPGVEVRPILTLDGMHVLNQVFFNDVHVPEDCRIGPEGGGWAILKQNIGLERIFNGSPSIARGMRRRLVAIADREDAAGGRVLDRPWFRERLARIDVRIAALDAITLSALQLENLAERPEASLLKARGTELQQDILRLTMKAAGLPALVHDREALRDGWREGASEEARLSTVTPFYLFMRKASISAGTNEIQRDIIAQKLLGPGA
jgi:alkylation response protein AidB-like acyl-CoA dehydrogenase